MKTKDKSNTKAPPEPEVRHTPGPWFQSHRKTAPDAYYTQVYTENGESICTVDWYPKPMGNGVTGTYREANARLISAAPELLASLKAFMEIWGSQDSSSSSKRAQGIRARMWDAANAAIAKATGGAK